MNQAEQLLKKSETLKGNRNNFETVWQSVADIFRPTKANIVTDKSKGDKSNIFKQYESMPSVAVSTLKSIIIGVLFNRSIKSISLESVDEETNETQEVAEWLNDYADMLLKNMFDPKSGFERALSEAVADDITIGTIATFIEKGKNFPIKYHTLDIANFYVAESSEGDVDYLVIKSCKTARQAVQEWGNKEGATLNEKVREIAEKTPFQELEFELHIMPREERDKSKSDKLNKAIAGFWIDKNHKSIIEELGWDSMPAAIGRSEKATNEDYGTSRAMYALADAYQINEMSKQINVLTELAGKPPLNVNANYNEQLNLSAGALNYPDQKSLRSGNSAVEQIITVGSVPLNLDIMMRKENNIRETFFLDKLKIFDNPNATATQVLELRAESFRIMGDFTTGLIDYLDQVLDRTSSVLFSQIYDINYNLIEGNGLFNKPLPDALIQNPKIKVNYINPITQSQKMTESASIDKLINDVGLIAEFKPDVLDLVNSDQVVRKKREILDIDPEILYDKARVSNTRRQRQEQEQQQQDLMQEQELVNTAATARKAGLA